MDNHEIVLGSQKIALWMEAKPIAQYHGAKGGYSDSTVFDYGKDCKTSPNGNRYISDVSMKYHTNWEWIMPCFAKIIEMEYWYEIHGNVVGIGKCGEKDWLVFAGHTSEKPIGMFNAIVRFLEFIKE